jgi:hypothetical protein
MSGCMCVDYLVDPVGVGTGSHEPIFPWYPHYLWHPPQPQGPVLTPPPPPGSPNAAPVAL